MPPHLEATVPVARAINPISGDNWEGIGVVPDVEAAADDTMTTAYRLVLSEVVRAKADGPRADVVAEARDALSHLEAGMGAPGAIVA